MSTLGNASRILLSTCSKSQLSQVTRRCLSTHSRRYTAFVRPLLLSTATLTGVATGYALHKTYSSRSLPIVHAAQKPTPQASVISGTKQHALYLWIKLKNGADSKRCANVAANLSVHVDAVCPPDLRDESDEIIAGVGFSPKFYKKLNCEAQEDYTYVTKVGQVGAMPNKQGDIFIHAKSDSTSMLFELAQRIIGQLPKDSVESYEDIYGFVYRGGRDLSGFIDGTENPADDDERSQVAIEPETGGSYVITQKWVHNLKLINTEKDSVMEGWVGRQRDDSSELKDKAITSHVARMTGGTSFEQKKVHRIVRQSQPYGNLHDHAGLFFIGYSHTPAAFNYMIDRMTGKDSDKVVDNIMKLTTCVGSTYWYFPGQEELKKLK